ncbi:hypothetical protein [Winogradskyella immobilis]|uniref:Lamin Tail Domain n=1 Tax=Winogradskyella immobilis TaxID=2816852 RepID=A0ABS8EJZ0_9FLAO|nr:hypothetical protein [Winogradskyella immobilis]MCC1483513.1 hypothetical protein [Winogradskyella immobilis]MCG0015607.1 hypothetical protein [Winogradskyella immobilis]
MKKLILLLLIPAFILSCSSDDDAIVIEENNGDGIIRITQVNTQGDLLVLSNLGTASTDVGEYYLCLGPGTYVRVANAASGSTVIAPNQSLTLEYDVNEASGGLSLFSTNSFSSSDPNILLDFMQWGAGNQARASQAVTAGRWDSVANFIPLGSPYNFTGEADQFGATFYEASEVEAATPVVRILQVDASADIVWLSNFGSESVDVGDYFLCLGPGTYVRVSDAASGSTTIAPGANIQLSYDVNETEDGLSIFSTNTNFNSSDPSILLDYVQWGAGNQARVDQAVTAGRWDNSANFVADGSPYAFTGEGDEFGSTFWEGTEADPLGVLRILQVNPITDQVWLTNVGDAALDAGDYWLCLGPGTYAQVSTRTSGSTVIEPGENIMLDYDMNLEEDGLSIFATNTFTSSDPDVLLDFVQWGAGNQPRSAQAVTAGRWDSAENFVDGFAPYSFIGEADEFGSTFWDTAAESRTVRILQFNAQTDQVWLSNFGNTAVEIGDYFLCLGPGTYVQVSTAANGASTELAPGENVMLSYNVNESVDGLSIFSTNSFGSTDPNILIDYVQWGDANQMRVSQAVTAGRWDSAANFVEGGPSYSFNGNENDFGSTFWD